MTLTDAQVERYSRQILVPEVGGKGQTRLLAARVAVAGAGAAAVHAATLLGRAGVGHLDLVGGPSALGDLGADCRVERAAAVDAGLADVVLDLGADADGDPDLGRAAQAAGRPLVIGRLNGGGVSVATLVGRPCLACLPAGVLGPEAGAVPTALGAALELVLGALAAGEALQALWGPPRRGVVQRLDACGRPATTLLDAARGCPACGGTA
jgi:adenylyltransferase/sulfurtransferase